MSVNSVYQIANDAVAAALTGDNIKIVDTSTLVSVGTKVFSSSDIEARFLNKLVQRIGKVIFDEKSYTTRFVPMLRTDYEWGAMAQELRVKYGDFKEDPSLNLINGQSVDMYVINKPDVENKFYMDSAAFADFVTISRALMKDAFTNAEGMARLIRTIFLQIRNKINFALERLGYLTMDNYIAVLSKKGNENQVIHLITEYEAATGNTAPDVAAILAGKDVEFLKFVGTRIRTIRRYMDDISTKFNVDKETEFSVGNVQSVFHSSVTEALKSYLYADTFHTEDVIYRPTIEVNYWQNENDRLKVMVTPRMNDNTVGESITVENIAGMIYDKSALGIYQTDSEAATTPYNAAGRYYNTWYHERQQWFNNFGKNAVLFLLD